jgi:lambda family phage portal protein
MTATYTGPEEPFDPYQSSYLTRPAFHAASTDYKNAQRDAILADADLLALGELTLIRSRSRSVVRNNPVGRSARNKFTTTHGAIKVQWKTKDGKKHPLMQDLWEEHYAKPTLDGKGSGDTLQATWLNDRFESGEAFGRFLIIKKGNSSRIPLKIQSIEAEYLDPAFCGFTGNELFPLGRTRYGITFDETTLSIPETYNFYRDRHFGLNPDLSSDWYVPIPARDVLHIFERDRSNQWRGVPLLASALLSLYELEDLCTATVQTQTAASAIAWVVERSLGNLSDLAPGTASMRGTKSITDPTQKLHFQTTGGSVQYAEPGEKINLVQSKDIGNNLTALLKEEYQKIAASIDLPYYSLTGDTNGMDFSSLRGILTSFRNRIEFIYNIVTIPDAIAPWATRFKEIAVALQYAVSDAIPTYQYPRWYGIDDLKDAQADLLEVVSGFTPISAVWAERGYTEEEITQSIEMIKALGLESLLLNTVNPAQNNGAPTSATTGS